MIQKLNKPENLDRVETGPVQFGDDWPGYFIRGDNCAGLIQAWEDRKLGSGIGEVIVENFFKDLKKSILHEGEST